MNKLVVDSSVFVSLFGKPDVFTKSSEDFFKRLRNNIDIILPATVLAETLLNVAKQELATNVAREKLLKFTIVPIDIPFIEKFQLSLNKPSMRTSDLIVASVAKFENATLISWDKRHLSKDNYLCSTFTPSQYIKNLKD